MSQSYEFYIERAEQSAREARAAQLENVRERALRSEKTWRGLAEHARGVAQERAAAERARTEAREKELEEAEAANAG